MKNTYDNIKLRDYQLTMARLHGWTNTGVMIVTSQVAEG